jgi:hypothetical protein
MDRRASRRLTLTCPADAKGKLEKLEGKGGLMHTPEKPFYRYALQYGLTETDFNGSHETHLLDDSHPYIHVDMSQCIVCYRCVRICEEVQGLPDLGCGIDRAI